MAPLLKDVQVHFRQHRVPYPQTLAVTLRPHFVQPSLQHLFRLIRKLVVALHSTILPPLPFILQRALRQHMLYLLPVQILQCAHQTIITKHTHEHLATPLIPLLLQLLPLALMSRQDPDRPNPAQENLLILSLPQNSRVLRRIWHMH